MALLTPYREVLAVPGAAAFSLTGVVARLPISMASLGIVLLIEGGTGSYGIAGTVAAAYTVANAMVAIVQGRLIDRFGQRIVLGTGASVFSVAMLLLILSQVYEWSHALTYVFAAFGGGSLPQVSACVRARWSYILRGKRGLPTAFALEGVFDEVVFMTGPIIATILATQWRSWAGLAAAVVLGVAGTFAFVSQRATEPPARRHHSDATASAHGALPWRTILPLALVAVGMGVFFGAAEVNTVAYTEERGHPAAAGLLLALWATGSMTAGLIAGALSSSRGPALRVRVGSAAMALSLVPLLFIDRLAVAGGFLVIAGLAIAPTMIATFALAESVLPSGRLTEGMAVLQTGMVIGVAGGASLGGMVVDSHGASAAFLVCVVAATAGAVAAQFLPRSSTDA